MILASGSPQRKVLLEQLGVAFTVVVPEVEELIAGDPRAVVEENALRKARAVNADEIVLGADTEVVLDGRIYGKPRNRDEAERSLRELSGREHEVMTGIAIRRPAEGERSAVATTRVRFRELAGSDIDWYLETREWSGRAGGYAIQGKGAALVEAIDGDYSNVVGLPVPVLLALEPGLLRSGATGLPVS